MARILVVDDDPDLLLLVRTVLTGGGHQVVESADTYQLREMIAELGIDVVVLDVMMPERSGYEVLRELRGDEETRDVPTLFLSARAEAQDRVRGLREGADDYLAKPFDPEELLLRVERLARGSRRRPTGAPGLAELEAGVDGKTVRPGLSLGRYELVEVIGRGSMGWVFRARDPMLERWVALKTIRPAKELTPEQRRELLDLLLEEARTVARFNDSHLVAVYDVGGAGDEAPWVAMEYVDGRSLSDWLGKGEALPQSEGVALALGIARGLAAAHHHQVVHGDVKPANILLGRDGAIKVTDFGLAQVLSRLRQAGGKVFGTPGFIAPEVLVDRTYSLASDLFALGALLYRAFTGRPAFVGRSIMELIRKTALEEPLSPRQHRPELDPAVEELILQLLAKDPAHRPGSIEQVVERLADLAQRLEAEWRPDLARFDSLARQPTSSASIMSPLGEPESSSPLSPEHA